MRRVVVTGIGMCTPLGFGHSHCWEQLISSKSGIRKLTGFEIEDLKSKVGGQLILGRKNIPKYSKNNDFLVNACEYCKRVYSTQYNLNKHKKSCKDKVKQFETDNALKEELLKILYYLLIFFIFCNFLLFSIGITIASFLKNNGNR